MGLVGMALSPLTALLVVKELALISGTPRERFAHRQK
jgi:hypothetical protein